LLSSTASGYLQSQHKHKEQQYDSTGQNKQKTTTKNQFRLLTLKQEFLKASVHLQSVFAVETHLAEGQWLEEQLKMLKLPMFRVGHQKADRLFRGQRGNI
jgi:hypothetical protein